MRKLLAFILLGLFIFVFAAFFWPERRYVPFEVDAAYQEQVDNFWVPPMPADWVWSSYTAEDGTNLRWGETGNLGTADVTIIIIPGFTASISMYGEHIDLLAERGFHVVGIDLRGQGGSERHFPDQPEKLWVDDFSEYSNDLAQFLQSRDFSENHIVVPLGISFGGHVALRMSGDHPDLVDGLALLAPAIEPKAGNMEFHKALQLMNLMRKVGRAKRYVPGGGNWRPVGDDYSVSGIELCSSNPKRLYLRDAIFTNHPRERVGDVTNQWGAEFFESSLYIRDAGYLEGIKQPIFIASAEVDNFVSNAANEDACNNRLPNCKLVRYEGTGHCLPQESNKILFSIFNEIDLLANRLRPQ